MKNLLYFLLFTFLMCCSTYGHAQSVYPTKFPSEPAVKLAVVWNSGAADLVVYKVSSESAAGNNNGLWYFQSFPDSTTKKIFFLSDTSAADLKISFTSNPANAGWVNSAKMYLLN